MDRIDLFIEVPAVKYEKLTADESKEYPENQSQAIREKIETIAKEIYGAGSVVFSEKSKKQILMLETEKLDKIAAFRCVE